MIQQLKTGFDRLHTQIDVMAEKFHLPLDKIIIDDGEVHPDHEPYIVQIHCDGKVANVPLSTSEICSYSINAQHKLFMAMMKFVPLA